MGSRSARRCGVFYDGVPVGLCQAVVEEEKENGRGWARV
jgi:hypothetical protein